MTDGGGRRRRAFIGSFTAAGGSGIVTAAVAADSGALTALSSVDGVPDPSYLALAPDARTRSTRSARRPTGAVAAYRVTATGRRRSGAPVPVGGSGPTHLSVHAGHVLTANYGSGSVTAVPVRSDGTLAGAPPTCFQHTRLGPARPAPAGPARPPGAARPERPLGRQRRPRHGLGPGVRPDAAAASNCTGRSRCAPARGPRHLAFHPDGTHAYVLNELTPTVTVCRWDAADGTLKPLTEAPRAARRARTGDAYPSGIVAAPDGRFVWTATRGEDVLSTFAVEGGRTAAGRHGPLRRPLAPRARRVRRRFLYVANERSGDVTWFAVDPGTGLPRYEGSIEVPAASCVVFG